MWERLHGADEHNGNSTEDDSRPANTVSLFWVVCIRLGKQPVVFENGKDEYGVKDLARKEREGGGKRRHMK